MKKFGLLIAFLMCSSSGFCQVDFTQSLPHNSYTEADSAIVKGEFGDVHSLLVVQNGKLVFEQYYNGWRADSVHELQSVTKSVVATLLGCALKQGFIKSTEERVQGYFPQFDFSDPRRAKITIADLLTQRHGWKWQESPWESPDNRWRLIMETNGDWYKSILETTMETEPGIDFKYSNGPPALIVAMIQRAANMNIDRFAIKYLFNPLDIKAYWFWPDNGGPQNNGMALISLTSRDMSKIGQLYLQNGKWERKQILSADYVKTATSGIVKDVAPGGAYESHDYGYFWWSDPIYRPEPHRRIEVFMARGYGGQRIIVWPEKNMVAVITGWNTDQTNKTQEIFDKYIIPFTK